MMPQEPFSRPPVYQPTFQQRITDAGGQAAFYGQTPAEQEAGRARQGGGQDAARMPAEEWAMRSAHNDMRRSAAYADADQRRRPQPSTPRPLGREFSSVSVGAEKSLPPSSSALRSDDDLGAGAGIVVLLLTAAVCLPPFLHHNGGVGFGHLGWDIWKLIAFGAAVAGPLFAASAFWSAIRKASGRPATRQ